MSDVAVHQPAQKKKGPVITFSGAGGSGKSALAKVAAGELRRKGYPVRMIRVYPLSLRNVTVSLFRPDSGRSQIPPAGYSNPPAAFWKRILFRICMLLLELFIQILSNRGTAVVCDRYLYDSLAELYENGACGKRFFDRHARSIPPPDVAFLLRPKEDPVIRSEGTTDSGRGRKKRDAYLKLTDWCDFWILDANFPERAKMEVAGILSHEYRHWI